MKKNHFSRRNFLISGAVLSSSVLVGCTTSPIKKWKIPDGIMRPKPFLKAPKKPTAPPRTNSLYSALPNEKFPLPAIDTKEIPNKYLRQRVVYRTQHPVGSVIVDTKKFFLYLIEKNGMAMRYGVGLGRQGFEWSGKAKIAWKQEWPKWTPPDEMVARKPELEKYSIANGGMPPGLDNPLGARALYIFQDNVDTLYRVHGTPQHWTIGKAISSGCVRMINQDVIDLYNRVRTGSQIVVT